MGRLKRKGKLRERFSRMSLKKTLAAYIILGILGTLLVILVIQQICQAAGNSIKVRYADYYPGMSEIPMDFYVISRNDMTWGDRTAMEWIDFVQTWSPFVCIIGGVTLVSVAFYRNKLKIPLKVLTESTGRIGKNDLDFRCEYHSEDEMGKLCESFETMRKNLADNYRKMWDMMEEQKRLNHAFAHDLRTPLTVLRGYVEFLERYYPEGKIGEEKLLETLAMMDRQVERLQKFGDTMKNVGTLEERQCDRKPVEAEKAFGALREMGTALEGQVRFWMDCRIPGGKILWLDEAVFREVAENLFSNGLRYAENWVQVILRESAGYLELYVKDDGPGFDEEGLRMAVKPYYKDKNRDSSGHFGIGLYICRVLCELHGGSVSVHNSVEGGAIVSAVFQILPEP